MSQPTIIRLPQLLRELRTGELRIPPFQRNFEWQGEQRLHLLDSVRKGLPSGGLMVWRTTKDLSTDPQLGPIHAALPLVEPGATRQYLLDGRQRITTLFAALGPALWQAEDEDIPSGFDGEAPDGTPWAVHYDLADREFTFEALASRIPVAFLLDDYKVDEWLRDRRADRRTFAAVRALKSAFHDYSVPLTPLHTDDIETVTLTFKRINRAGTPMGDMAMARALLWTDHGFDLDTEIDKVVADLEVIGWGELDRELPFKVLASIAGLEPARLNVEELAVALRSEPAHLDRLRPIVVQTVGLLERMGIRGPHTLPYKRAFTTMARWLARNTDKPFDDMALMASVAASCLSEEFSSAPPHVMTAIQGRLDDAALHNKWPARNRRARPARKFNMGWARSRVAAIVLAGQNPLDGFGHPLFDDAQQAVGEQGNTLMCRLLESGGTGVPVEVSHAIKGLSQSALGAAANRLVCSPRKLNDLRRAIFAGEPKVCNSHLFGRPPGKVTPEGLLDWLQAREERLKDAEIRWLQSLHPKAARVSWDSRTPLSRLP